jgi:hypothetical protein
VLHADAAGNEAGGGVLLELLLEIGSPAELGELEDLSGLSQANSFRAREARPRARKTDQSAGSIVNPRADAKSSVVIDAPPSSRVSPSRVGDEVDEGKRNRQT